MCKTKGEIQMGDILKAIIVMIYIIAGYWATGQTIYANKIIIYSGYEFFIKRLFLGFGLGWILIPIALLKNH
jgi:hypothetical protein